MKALTLLACLAWLADAPAEAANVASCAVGATPISFGAYDPTSSTPVTPTGSITVTCNLISGVSLLVAYTITLSTGSSGNYLTRTMTGTTTPMNYNLYTNGGMTQVWGDGVTANTSTDSGGYLLGLGSVVLTYTVYAKLPAQQLVAAGIYADNITASISY